jgi:5-methylcytosine-specific restriction endonuclease McrA
VFTEQPVCAMCSQELPWNKQRMSAELDHIMPLSQGGTDARQNLRGLCVEHHVKKSATERWMR